VLKAENLILSS